MDYRKILANSFATWCKALKTIGVGPEPISEIYAGRLYLGSITAASDLSVLLEHGVTHVICVTQFGDGARFFPYSMQYHVIKIMDLPTENMYQHFSGAIEFISDAFQTPGTCVFVHCIEGRSRSATIVLAYLMTVNKWSVEQAVNFLQWKRPIIDPNPGFIDDLRRLELDGF